MKAFISGIPEQYLNGSIYPILEETLGLMKDSRIVEWDIRKAREVLNKTKGIDLLVLGGAKERSPVRESESYQSAFELVSINRIIPSIILVYPVYQGVLDQVREAIPPHLGCTFEEFKNVTKGGLELVLKGRKIVL